MTSSKEEEEIRLVEEERKKIQEKEKEEKDKAEQVVKEQTLPRGQADGDHHHHHQEQIKDKATEEDKENTKGQTDEGKPGGTSQDVLRPMGRKEEENQAYDRMSGGANQEE